MKSLIEIVEERLISSMEKAVSLGWKICSGNTMDESSRRCCALGSLAIDDKTFVNRYVLIGESLGMSIDQILAFIDGFDQVNRHNYSANLYLDWYLLGKRLREKFVTS